MTEDNKATVKSEKDKKSQNINKNEENGNKSC